MTIEIRIDDLTDGRTRALIAQHHARMHAETPPDSTHALDVEAVRAPGITLWSAWIDEELAGVAALRELGEGRGELKSFRTADAFLGRGVARALLRRIIAEAEARGLTSLWLETGSRPMFAPAQALYAGEGFVECDAFEPYRPDPLSTFMTRAI
ncbi:GNAT family N-acetyltransferase [Microbacterium phosphatis]|uniref:GNAT family N-acetyltransferase n=1 Tax=Microbacterium phosphatis TaxID=3140248 RepID=UPI00314028F2